MRHPSFAIPFIIVLALGLAWLTVLSLPLDAAAWRIQGVGAWVAADKMEQAEGLGGGMGAKGACGCGHGVS